MTVKADPTVGCDTIRPLDSYSPVKLHHTKPARSRPLLIGPDSARPPTPPKSSIHRQHHQVRVHEMVVMLRGCWLINLVGEGPGLPLQCCRDDS